MGEKHRHPIPTCTNELLKCCYDSVRWPDEVVRLMPQRFKQPDPLNHVTLPTGSSNDIVINVTIFQD